MMRVFKHPLFAFLLMPALCWASNTIIGHFGQGAWTKTAVDGTNSRLTWSSATTTTTTTIPPGGAGWDSYSNYLAASYTFEAPYTNSNGLLLDFSPAGTSTGTIAGGTFTTNYGGRDGACMLFDGGNDDIRTTHSVIPATTALVYCAWINMQFHVTDDVYLGFFNNANPYYPIGIIYQQTPNRGVAAYLGMSASWAIVNASNDSGYTPSNAWMHLTLSYNSTEGISRFWTNGVFCVPSSETVVTNIILSDALYRFTVASAGGTLGRYVNAYMDGIRVYTNLALMTNYPSRANPILTNIWFHTKDGLDEIGY